MFGLIIASLLFFKQVSAILHHGIESNAFPKPSFDYKFERSGKHLECFAGEFIRHDECDLIPARYYTTLAEKYAMRCDLATIPGAAFCNPNAGKDCQPGEYENFERQCAPVPKGYYNPHNTTFGVYYKCFADGSSDQGSTRCVYKLPEVTIADFERSHQANSERHRILQVLPSCTTNVVIPNGITSIPAGAYENCGLRTVTIPSTVTYIGLSAFENCLSLTTVIFAPGSQLTTLADRVFCYDSALANINLPNGVTSMGQYAFYSTGGFNPIVIPNSVTSWGNNVFMYSNVISIVISNRLNSITFSSFEGCYSLVNATVSTVGTPTMQTIADRAFCYDSALRYAVLPPSVTSMGQYSFYSTGGFNPIVIPNSVTSWGNNVFMYSSILSAVISNRLNSITFSSFEGCSYIQSVYIPPSGATMASISDRAFCYAYAFSNINLPNSVTSIGQYSFYENAFQTFIFPSNLTSIASATFYNNPYLRTVTFQSCPSFGSSVFYGTPSTCLSPNSVYCPASGLSYCISYLPSLVPTFAPTPISLKRPSIVPTVNPTSPTHKPTKPTNSPTVHPTTHKPSIRPTSKPTRIPTSSPSQPTSVPSYSPTVHTNYLAAFTTTQGIQGANNSVLSSSTTQSAFVSSLQHVLNNNSSRFSVTVHILSVIVVSNVGPTPTYGYVYNTTYVVPNGVPSKLASTYQTLSTSITMATINNVIASNLLSSCASCGLPSTLSVNPATTMSSPAYIQTPLPTSAPSYKPIVPSHFPSTSKPTTPSIKPTLIPTSPSLVPSKNPSVKPSLRPSYIPSLVPTLSSLAPTIQGQCFCNARYCLTDRQLNTTQCAPGPSPQVYH